MTGSGAVPEEDDRRQRAPGNAVRAEAFAVDLFLCGAALVALSLPTLTRSRLQDDAPPAPVPEGLTLWEGEGGAAAPLPPAAEAGGKPGWATVGLAIGLGAGMAVALPMSEAERRAIRRTGTAAGRIARHQVIRELSWARRLATDSALACLDAVDDAMHFLGRRITRTAEHAAEAVASRLDPRKH